MNHTMHGQTSQDRNTMRQRDYPTVYRPRLQCQHLHLRLRSTTYLPQLIIRRLRCPRRHIVIREVYFIEGYRPNITCLT